MAQGWTIEETCWPTDWPSAVRAFAGVEELAWLDSTAVGVFDPSAGRYGLLGVRPLAVIEQFDRQPARLVVGRRVVAEHDSAWALWRQTHRRLPKLAAGPWGLMPGWVGYVGFETARQLERLPASHREDLGLPLFRMALFDRGIVLDHLTRRAVAASAPGLLEALGLSRPPDADDRDWLVRWEVGASAPDGLAYPRSLRVWPDMLRSSYEQMVARALDYIAAGDIYQVNLAQRLRIEGVEDALATYAAIRRSNPAPYGAFLRWDGGALASVSPELFLRLRDGQVLTGPIKGTRPRTGHSADDEVQRRALLASPKEAAELAMIIDLHRNDLGRVCEYGSVQVVHPRRVEAHPTVFHTVADIAGRLRPGQDGLDLLAACFPAGSISGVPKIRALQIIDELEPVARGAYTGAVGVLGLDGHMTFNVAIRTLQMREKTATLYVGGGIVADSDPAAEYEETLAKARGILRGITNGELRMPSCGASASSG